MSQELLAVFEYLEREKGIPREAIISAVESSLVTASKKAVGLTRNLEVKIDPRTADITVTAEFEVVGARPDAPDQISLARARQSDAKVQVGDIIRRSVPAASLGRIAAHTARQVIMQKLRDAERAMVLNEFKDRVNSLVSGVVQRYSHGTVIVDVGKAEAILPPREQIPSEKYPINSRVSAYLVEVADSPRGPELVLSRSHPNLVRKLFELEVPEIAQGTVTIKGIARDPGHRSKIAVHSSDPKVDSVGACVGMRGARVKNIVRELSGEKVDIIRWDPDLFKFLEEALKPVVPKSIEVDEENRAITVICDNDQLSQAIGKRGQNVRLISKMLGWHVEIFSEANLQQRAAEFIEYLSELPGIGREVAQNIFHAGYTTIELLGEAHAEELSTVEGMSVQMAERLISFIRDEVAIAQAEVEQEMRETPADTQKEAPSAAPLPSAATEGTTDLAPTEAQATPARDEADDAGADAAQELPPENAKSEDSP